MYLEKIKIKNFKKIIKLETELNKNINIFIGNNAQGKTSILESIYVLALTKPSKSVEESDLINKSSNFSLIKGTLVNEKSKKEMEFILTNQQKTLKINKKEIKKVGDYLTNLNVIMFSPDDLDIIKKSPLVRRNLLNIELCQLFPNYMKVLNEYNKILKIRNEYLRKNYGNMDKAYFDIITEKLVDRLIIIRNYRQKYVECINSKIEIIYKRIMKTGNLKVVYDKNISFESKEEIINYYKDNYYNELDKKMTLFGIQKDDLLFYVDDMNLKDYGSQGQQRVAVLSFKLAEINIFKETKKTYPIVLLDDIFSELDIEKRNNLLKFIKSNIQFIITTTDIKNISEKIVDKAKRPGMYIVTTDVKGLHHLVWEIVDNSIDEALAGYCKHIEIVINKDNSITVKDDGRGIPTEIHPKTKISTVETVYTVLHAGGKFGGGGYKVSGGLHGVGASVVNALSKWLEVTVYKNGQVHFIRFENGGHTVEPLKVIGTCSDNRTGTTVTFKPDPEIFDTDIYNYETLKVRVRELAFLNKGLSLNLRDDRDLEDTTGETFCYEGGISEYV